ncbi:MAG: hypothetical protein EPN70_03180 [Paraburkholderia sp.]|uniref:hypothetical protein n=1 Tax=Paraburkholderia sp. TaxID=1926495 RepID=UPI0012092A03|nr:hypothetical protein [Paraburkholderia sp.]TAM07307.1 MAG: hypothetical protein EPN70_03180 [Paraburkholderia sp.]TAM30814.1 MAG: hypothetical protein EPN59_07165 [Paraburkholderia sp.]
MKPICFAAALIVFTTGCTSASSPANNQTVRPRMTGTNAYILHAPERVTPGDAAAHPPRLSVGTSYPDTQLILPWFLNDIINFVNYR